MAKKSYLKGSTYKGGVELIATREISEIEHEVLNKATGIIAQITRRIGECAKDIRTEIRASMKKTPRDKVRITSDRRRFYKGAPSKPGHPPAIQTTNLYDSIQYVVNKARGEAEVGVTVAAPYGKYLEYGAVRKGKNPNILLPRPFLAPAVEKKWPETIDKIKWDIERLTNS